MTLRELPGRYAATYGEGAAIHGRNGWRKYTFLAVNNIIENQETKKLKNNTSK